MPKGVLVLHLSSPPQTSVPAPAVIHSPSSPGPSVKIQPTLEPTPVSSQRHSLPPQLIGQSPLPPSMIGSQQTQPLSPSLIGQKQSLSPSLIGYQQPIDEMDDFDFALEEDMSPNISATSQNEEQVCILIENDNKTYINNHDDDNLLSGLVYSDQYDLLISRHHLH